MATQGEARARVLAAALRLFSEHGVEGTSLQMIADELGVTKAAIYFQFKAKSDIVLALIRPAIHELAAVAEAAGTRRGRSARLDATVSGVIDVVVRYRDLVALLHGDHTAADLLAQDEEMKPVIDRLGLLLLGPDPAPEDLVVTTMLGNALMLSSADHALAEVDDGVLRDTMLATARRMLRLRSRG